MSMLGLNLVNRRIPDPRMFNPHNLVAQVKNRIGFGGGITWGLKDTDIMYIIQSEGLMIWSGNFANYTDWVIDVCPNNRMYPSKKGYYYHNLPEDQILIGIEKVYPGIYQPSSFGDIPRMRGQLSGGAMTKAENSLREFRKQSVPMTAKLHPAGAVAFGVEIDPMMWLNENDSKVTMKIKLAHSLDFSTIPPGYQAAFTDWATICVCTYIKSNIIPRMENLNTEVGQYSGGHREPIEQWANKYDEYKIKMTAERMYDPNRQKILR